MNRRFTDPKVPGGVGLRVAGVQVGVEGGVGEMRGGHVEPFLKER